MLHIAKIILLLLSLTYSLSANNQLKKNYFVKDSSIFLSDIIPHPKKDIKLFTINTNRHSKRIKSKELLKLLKDYGYSNFSSKSSYIQFSLKSPINTKKIQKKIKEYYKEKYQNITIKKITLHPRSFLEEIPKEYSTVLSKKSFLKKDATLYIKTQKNKKIFFNYNILATITIITARTQIEKGDELSNINTKKSSILLDKFRAMPLQNIKKSTYEAKHKIKKGTILTHRDIVGLYIVKRGDKINVTIHDSNIAISFMAPATKNARLGDTITIKNQSGKKLKAVVTGRNRAEIQ